MEKKEEKPAAQAPEHSVKKIKPHADKTHHIKVTQMNLEEVNKALEEAQKHMGGLHSQYARALAARREYLLATQGGSNELKLAA